MTRSHTLTLGLLLGSATLCSAQTKGSGASFKDIWGVVEKTRPYGEEEALPARKPVKAAFPKGLIPEGIRAVFLTPKSRYATSDNTLIVRSRLTTSPGQTNDLRGTKRDHPKPLHPLGVAFSAGWEINANSPFTGLFAPGVRLPYAIVRVSSGTLESTNHQDRIMGMAIKLFPTQDPGKAVLTRNILTLDQFGFDSDRRVRPFHANKGTPIYFTNFAPPADPDAFLPRNLNRFFNHFDAPNEHRPIKALAEVDADGQPIKRAACAPFEIVFRPAFKPRFRLERGTLDAHRHKHLRSFRQSRQALQHFRQGALYPRFPYDFRDVIRAYDPADKLRFEIQYVPWEEGVRGAPKPLGFLTITSKPVVSDGGDLDLHFHHLIHEEQPEPAKGKKAKKKGLADRVRTLQKEGGGCPLGH